MRFRLALLLGLPLALHAADKGEPLNLKAGLWQVTTTTAPSDDVMVPAALLEKLTPEQRARVEERMNAKPADAPRMIRRKYCLTKEQLDKGATFGQDRKSCTRSILASTSDMLEMRIECAGQRQGISSAETLLVEATDPENVKGYVHRTMDGDGPESSISTFTARWIGPICSPTK